MSSGLSQHESFQWSVTTRLLSLEEIPSIALRIDIRATESCPEDLLSYQITTVPFQASLFDLLIPDQSVVSQQQMLGQPRHGGEPLYPFHLTFSSLPYALTKKVMAQSLPKKRSPAAMEGDVSQHAPELFKLLARRLQSNMQVCILTKKRLGLQAITWDGQKFAIQFTRAQTDGADDSDQAADESLHVSGAGRSSNLRVSSTNVSRYGSSNHRVGSASSVEVWRMEMRSTSESLLNCIRRQPET